MRMDVNERGDVTITLSKRNLLALLHKVDQEWSNKRIESFNAYNHEGAEVDLPFAVVAEPDETHYSERPAWAVGVMHPDTQAFISENAGKSFNGES